MRRVVTALVALVVIGLGCGLGCGDDQGPIPVAVAPPSRHGALHDALRIEARSFSFREGDWLEDLGDAPFYGVGWLVRAPTLEPEEAARRDAALVRTRALLGGDLLSGDLQEKVMAALGLIDRLARVPNPDDQALLDAFVDRLDGLTKLLGDYLDSAADQSWAIRTYGPTAVTALVALVSAQYAAFLDGPRRGDRLERARALDAKIVERALGDLTYAPKGRSVRAYAIGPGSPSLDLYPNVAMLLLKARLYRATRDEGFRLEARALYAAIQPLKLADAPARYASPYAVASLGAKTPEVFTLSSQNYLALALAALFEITGDRRFIDEMDRALDGIEAMRGPWCLSQVHHDTCTPVCPGTDVCVAASCSAERCTTGLLHHVVDGRLARPGDPTLFCSGCNWQTLYVLGYRRDLAGESF